MEVAAITRRASRHRVMSVVAVIALDSGLGVRGGLRFQISGLGSAQLLGATRLDG